MQDIDRCRNLSEESDPGMVAEGGLIMETRKSARINLDVPFYMRKYAKACGAYWDRKRKVWYTYAAHHGAKALSRFMSDVDKKVYGFKA
jgi:hypothetical protein